MSSVAKLTGADFDAMVDRGLLDAISPKKVELIRGKLRFRNPAGPLHSDYIIFLTDWSYEQTLRTEATISVQNGFICEDNRPEPDALAQATTLWPCSPDRIGRLVAD